MIFSAVFIYFSFVTLFLLFNLLINNDAHLLKKKYRWTIQFVRMVPRDQSCTRPYHGFLLLKFGQNCNNLSEPLISLRLRRMQSSNATLPWDPSNFNLIGGSKTSPFTPVYIVQWLLRNCVHMLLWTASYIIFWNIGMWNVYAKKINHWNTLLCLMGLWEIVKELFPRFFLFSKQWLSTLGKISTQTQFGTREISQIHGKFELFHVKSFTPSRPSIVSNVQVRPFTRAHLAGLPSKQHCYLCN